MRISLAMRGVDPYSKSTGSAATGFASPAGRRGFCAATERSTCCPVCCPTPRRRATNWPPEALQLFTARCISGSKLQSKATTDRCRRELSRRSPSLSAGAGSRDCANAGRTDDTQLRSNSSDVGTLSAQLRCAAVLQQPQIS